MQSDECTATHPWIGDASLYPELGTHVQLNGHTGYVRATHPGNGTLDFEMVGYRKKAPTGQWAACYMDPYALGLGFGFGRRG